MLTAACLVALTAGSLVLRTRAIGVALWTDEGLSVGIAAHGLTEIPGLLRQDGSPPLYYLLLHGWMRVFGTSEAEVRALSLVFALVTIPAAYWLGSGLFGRRAGLLAAAGAATLPFLTRYAQEARMYSLVALLGLVAAGAFVHAFARGERCWIPVFALALALLLYTHNWSVFFALAALVVAVALRAPARDVALAFGTASLAFAPWVPTLLFQAAHTGAPWSAPPPVVALLAALGLGAAAVVSWRLGGAAWRAPAALAALASLALGAAWAAAHLEPMWASRYLAILVGPLLLAGAAALARAGRAGLVAGAVLVVLGGTALAPEAKSNFEHVAATVAGRLSAADLVFVTKPEEVPALAYYLGYDRRYATPLGTVRDPGVVDWRDAVERLERARPGAALDAILADVAAGRRLLVLRPSDAAPGPWGSTWLALVRRRSDEWAAAFAADQRLTGVRAPAVESGDARAALVATLYVRRSP